MTATGVGRAERRFLCDAMFARLGRWLRAAGYDTAIAAGCETDRALVERALAEGRLLLTRDPRSRPSAARRRRPWCWATMTWRPASPI